MTCNRYTAQKKWKMKLQTTAVGPCNVFFLRREASGLERPLKRLAVRAPFAPAHDSASEYFNMLPAQIGTLTPPMFSERALWSGDGGRRSQGKHLFLQNKWSRSLRLSIFPFLTAASCRAPNSLTKACHQGSSHVFNVRVVNPNWNHKIYTGLQGSRRWWMKLFSKQIDSVFHMRLWQSAVVFHKDLLICCRPRDTGQSHPFSPFYMLSDCTSFKNKSVTSSLHKCWTRKIWNDFKNGIILLLLLLMTIRAVWCCSGFKSITARRFLGLFYESSCSPYVCVGYLHEPQLAPTG